jgi:general secretion pathway protein B
MSLILEALKKAERQHKLGEVPSLGAQPANASPPGMRGLGWLMLVLFACLMLGLGLYLGGFRLAPSAQEKPVVSVPSVAEPPVIPQPAAPIQASAPVTEVAPEPPLAEMPPPPPPKPARPLSEMPSGFLTNLPSLSIDIHSYDKRPAKRYVLINMEKYHEGDYLAEGPQLIEILPDGAILDYLGERFILPIGNQ